MGLTEVFKYFDVSTQAQNRIKIKYFVMLSRLEDVLKASETDVSVSEMCNAATISRNQFYKGKNDPEAWKEDER